MHGQSRLGPDPEPIRRGLVGEEGVRQCEVGLPLAFPVPGLLEESRRGSGGLRSVRRPVEHD
eukprot:11615277-Alexandrium_andersonii.AAC.1